ncbi:essential MCU regulator, mitochondrial [Vombatus ursinus]|uniref:essential MCU regulator, mitochondrial n=1 Tax=Vombatus ursinus TaxID=29139 RepID=UPI000FFD105A|nr:essential MCU regulator, mitochondrial [Vombatus ursinus]
MTSPRRPAHVAPALPLYWERGSSVARGGKFRESRSELSRERRAGVSLPAPDVTGQSVREVRDKMSPGAARWLAAAAAARKAGSGLGQGPVPSRSLIATRSGAILPKPAKMSFGLLRVFSIVIPFLYVGTLISKNFAALLEEHDIFVPEDDDDDD